MTPAERWQLDAVRRELADRTEKLQSARDTAERHITESARLRDEVARLTQALNHSALCEDLAKKDRDVAQAQVARLTKALGTIGDDGWGRTTGGLDANAESMRRIARDALRSGK